MSDTLKPGLIGTRRVDIDRDKTISFMGDDCRVYSTPNLLYDIEMACRDLLLQHIDAGKDSVGTRVELDHVGQCPMCHRRHTRFQFGIGAPAVAQEAAKRPQCRNELNRASRSTFRCTSLNEEREVPSLQLPESRRLLSESRRQKLFHPPSVGVGRVDRQPTLFE